MGSRCPIPLGERKLPMKPGDPARTAPVVATETALLGALGDSRPSFAKAGERRVEIDRSRAHDGGHLSRSTPGRPKHLGRSPSRGSSGSTRPMSRAASSGSAARSMMQSKGRRDPAGADRKRALQHGADHADPGSGQPGTGAHDRRGDRAAASHGRRRARVQHQPRRRPPASSGKTATCSATPNISGSRAEGGQQIAGFRANFRRPDFLAIDQDFLATAEIANDTPVAYHSRRAIVSAGLERRFRPAD